MATLEMIFSNDACDILYNADLHVIQTRWKNVYVYEEPLRNILDEIIKALELKQTSIIIADAREMHIIGKSDQDWITYSWYPRAVAAGFRFQGLILSKDTYNEVTVKKISKEYDTTIVTTQYFRTPSEALDWVREIQETQTEN